MALAEQLTPVGFGDLPGWGADAQAGAFAAFRRSAFHALGKRYRTGALGITAEAFEPAFADARRSATLEDSQARAFFERHFVPCRVSGGPGLVTGFYEPVAEASPVRTARFAVPLLERPADLVDIDDANRPPGFDPAIAFGRSGPGGIEAYADRRAIETGAIEGKARPFAWLESKVDAFFIHVQGAARLRFPDGRVRRVTYAAKSGHPFTGPGRVLVERGEIPREGVSMQAIRAWLARNPDRVDDILWLNRSYIFFREAEVDDPDLGPIAAAKVPLTPGRSIAVDRLLHTFGTPVHVDAPTLKAFGGDGFRRLMIAQDTGSAIVGPERGDLFAGSGDAAGEIAGVVNAPAAFFALVPRGLAGPAR